MSVEVQIVTTSGADLGRLKLGRVPCIGEKVAITGLAPSRKVLDVVHWPLRDLRGPEVAAQIEVE